MSYRQDADMQILHGQFYEKNTSITWQVDDMEELIRKYNYGIDNAHLAHKSKEKIILRKYYFKRTINLKL